MALEVKVFREITDYQAKVMFGLSWRQVGTALAAVPVLAGSYAGFYLAGLDDLGVVAVCLLAMPAAGYGWVRPMGIAFEKYFRYFWDFSRSGKTAVYQQIDFYEVEVKANVGKEKPGFQGLARRKRKNRKKLAAFEAAN